MSEKISAATRLRMLEQIHVAAMALDEHCPGRMLVSALHDQIKKSEIKKGDVRAVCAFVARAISSMHSDPDHKHYHASEN